MPRKITPLVTGETYHIFNRGVDKRVIFNSEKNYLRFYNSLIYFNSVNPKASFRDAARISKNGPALVEVHAYCLLPNHFHLILKQLVDGGISDFMKRISTGYTGHFNDKNERSGSLFQGTFKRVHIETDEQYNYLFAYVNENHVVHNQPKPTKLYQTSSFHYQGIDNSTLVTQSMNRTYTAIENKKLAKLIFNRRKLYKDALE